jgi:hypothetical protein
MSYKTKDIVARKIEWVGALFGINKREVIDLMYKSAYFIFCSPEYLKEKVEKFSKMLHIDDSVFKEICLQYPFVLQRSLEKLAENFERFTVEFETDENTIAKMYVKYPSFIYWNISDIRQIFGMSKNQKPGSEKIAIIEGILKRKMEVNEDPTQLENFENILSLEELRAAETDGSEGGDKGIL